MPLHMTDGIFVKIWDIIEQDDYILKILDVDHIDKEETNMESEISRNSVLVTPFPCYLEYIPMLSLNLL